MFKKKKKKEKRERGITPVINEEGSPGKVTFEIAKGLYNPVC